jgi:hypothetical protein
MGGQVTEHQVTDEIEALTARRAELEREIESLESTRVALYMYQKC